MRVSQSALQSKLGLGFCRRLSSSEPRKRFAALWGNGDFGRLGLGSLESQWRPAVCSAFDHHSLVAIACGGAHTLFLTGFLGVLIFVYVSGFWDACVGLVELGAIFLVPGKMRERREFEILNILFCPFYFPHFLIIFVF